MDEKILAELSLDEYIYLTENLEVIEHGGDKNAAAYILARKNSVIKRIVGLVLRNELTQEERDSFWRGIFRDLTNLRLREKTAHHAIMLTECF